MTEADEELSARIYRALRESDPIQGSGLPPWQKPRYDRMTEAVVKELNREAPMK